MTSPAGGALEIAPLTPERLRGNSPVAAEYSIFATRRERDNSEVDGAFLRPLASNFL